MTPEKKQLEIPLMETKRNDYFTIDPRNIEAVEDFNVRDDYGDMQWLIDDMRACGNKVPVQVYKKLGAEGIYILTDGFRRHKAAMALIEEGQPIKLKAICEPKGYSDESRLIDMFTLAEGNKKLNAVEQAKVIGRLIAYGLEVKDIAERIHKSPAYISNLNQLNQAPVKIKKLITSNIVKATLVSEILRKEKDYDKAFAQIEAECEKKGIKTSEITSSPDNSPENTPSKPEVVEKEKAKKTEKKKITKKDFQKSAGKVNSVSHLRKFMKYFDKLQLKLQLEENTTQKAIEELIPNEKQEIFSVLRGIYEGVITIDSLKELFNLAAEPVTEEK